jgi:hypothetical protein
MKVVKRNYYDEDGNLFVKPYRLKDLAEIYGVSNKVLKKWITNAVPDAQRKGGLFFSIRDVEAIINVLGLPKKILPFKKAA